MDARDQIDFDVPYLVSAVFPERAGAAPEQRKCSYCGKDSDALAIDQLWVIKHTDSRWPQGYLNLYCADHLALRASGSLPTWDQLMAPVIDVLWDGSTRATRDLEDAVAKHLALTEAQLEETLGSGQKRYTNRIGWATSYLTRAGALTRPSRGRYVLTQAGRDLRAANPTGITERDLRRFLGDENAPSTAKLLQAAEAAGLDRASSPEGTSAALDPVEQIEQGIKRIHAEVADELLSRLHAQDPAFFEQAVLNLLMAMGYGGAEGQATRTQLSGDGGIDGVIDQDALGLSRVYVQAKRYAAENVVGRPAIQGFVGALHGRQSNQGVFITTSRFSQEAHQYAESVSSRVILIDGQRLADLMIRYGVGVQTKQTITMVEIDEDFFE